jgi:ELWxxDGT repeat protein
MTTPSRSLFFVFALALSLGRDMVAQTPQLVRNMPGGGTAGTNPFAFTKVGKDVYFLGATRAGTQLWKTDGTLGGSAVVAVLGPPHSASLTQSPPTPQLVASGNLLYLYAYVYPFGTGIWRTDGTANGTFLIKLTSTSGPIAMDAVGSNGLLFSLIFGGLWVTDGTVAGTRALSVMSGQPFASRVVHAGNRTYFVLDLDSTLWVTDGTDGGTRNIGTCAGALGQQGGLVDLGGRTLMVCTEQSTHLNLQIYDGTSTPATIAQIAAQPVSNPVVTNGKAFFMLSTASGDQLWTSDGTAAGTGLVSALNGGRSSQPVVTGNGLVYVLDRTNGAKGDLFRSDGTAEGTFSIFPTTDALGVGSVSMAGGDTRFYFSAQGGTGAGLWISDGTRNGTTLLSSVSWSVAGLTGAVAVLGDSILFGGSDGKQIELWRTDGTTDSTVMLNLNPDHGTPPSFLARLGNAVLFDAFDSQLGHVLWRTDGTADGTTIVKVIRAAFNPQPLLDITSLGQVALFSADDGVHGRQLWRTDGTGDGTTVLKDIRPAASSFGFVNDDEPKFVVLNGVAYFQATERGASVSGFWRSDGTDGGIIRLGDVGNSPVVYGNSVLFGAPSIWQTDGTVAGTTALASSLGTAVRITPSGQKIFFVQKDSTTGAELWVMSDRSGSPHLVKDINPGPADSLDASVPGNRFLQDLDGTLLFTADDGMHGLELWRSDGTAAGTQIVKDINPGPAPAFVLTVLEAGQHIVFNHHLYFAAADGVLGRELWVSDGTTEGTHMVRDIAPGPASSWPEQFVIAGGRLYFSADDGMHGRELWSTDGTDGGTRLVADLEPGPRSSDPQFLLPFGSSLLFAASTDDTGVQLWKVLTAVPARRRAANEE